MSLDMYLPPVSIAQSWNFNQKQKEDFPNETLPSLSSPLPPPPPPHFLRHILNQVFNFSISTSNFPQIETNSNRGLSVLSQRPCRESDRVSGIGISFTGQRAVAPAFSIFLPTDVAEQKHFYLLDLRIIDA